MKIRLADKKDAKELAILSANNITENFSEKDFVSSINSKQEIVILCENNNKIFGYAVAGFAADEAELFQIASDCKIRREGVGSALFLRLLGILKSNGVGAMFLEVRETNVFAINFYKKYGMKEVGRRQGFYNNPSEDALIMRLDIDA